MITDGLGSIAGFGGTTRGLTGGLSGAIEGLLSIGWPITSGAGGTSFAMGVSTDVFKLPGKNKETGRWYAE
jgi:hypothetical protein